MFEYLYDTPQRNHYKKIIDSIPDLEKQASLIEVKEGVILPPIRDEKLYWGLGGVITHDHQLVEESIVPGAFGGAYSFEEEKIDFKDEIVIFCGIMPIHWGHFIIDFLNRLWPAIFPLYDDYRIAFVPWLYGGTIDGVFSEVFDYLGIEESRLIKIERPTRFRKVLVAERTMSFAWSFDSIKFRAVISKILDNALRKAETINLEKTDKIYFTRTNFSKTDVGEWEIEHAFKINGYRVLCPEKLSLAEQIYYIQHAEIIVSLAGTICHNYIFSTPKTKFVILNRFHGPFWAQYRINYIFNLNVVWVDVYHQFTKYPENDQSWKVWVEFSSCLRKYFEDNSLAVPKISIWVPLRNWLLFKYHWTYLPLYCSFRHSVGKLLKRIF